MKIIAAPTHEQGQDFVIGLVQDHVMYNSAECQKMVGYFERVFGQRAALVGERDHRTYGPRDIVAWLQNIDPARLPWREFSVS